MHKPAGLQENVTLAPYTTLKIGGPARYFVIVKTATEAETAVTWGAARQLPLRVLGDGGNTLISDAGFPGLVIIMKNDQCAWETPAVLAGAGTKVGQLIAGGLQRGLGGLQWLIGVPSTVGGALYGNAGGHGWGLGDMVEYIDIITHAGERRRLARADCGFGYRTSAFKQHPDWVILQARLQLNNIDPTAERKLMATTTAQKNAAQPTSLQSAGCMFMNPTVEAEALPDGLGAHVSADGKISAWRLITAVGLQGYQHGRMQISPKHANFMINLGGATADQVVQLLSLVKQRVRDTVGVQLHEEVQYVGF
ncbi:MAG: UDP-N-acetylmuramate dehydrogenase [Candidatus Kerfeldbacteria bacterium]|nr:UDP-N-acetylmuramate dehydrogenase [Candidatus Kerfeldbacteria bacterium]